MFLALPVSAQEAAVIKSFDGGDAVRLFKTYCSSCHGWATGYDGIVDGSRIVPGDPEASDAWAYLDGGIMPPEGAKPGADERAALKAWILAGAPPPADVSSGATPAPGALPTGGFLGFPNKAAFHRAAGWTSAGLLLAAGVVGSVRAYNLVSAAHGYRDASGITEETMDGLCAAKIQELWSGGQALRWTHVGLLVAGESLYLANAITGIGFIGPDRPGVDRSDLHRWAFFLHGGLMMAEAVMGFFTTEALRAGDHETVSSLGVAHAAVGLAIPAIIIAGGAIMGR